MADHASKGPFDVPKYSTCCPSCSFGSGVVWRGDLRYFCRYCLLDFKKSIGMKSK